MSRNAGNSFKQPRSIVIRAKRATYTDQIIGGSEDYYHFRLKKRSYFDLRLKGLRADANVELIQDHNRNGEVDLGEVVASSRAPDRRAESIQIQGLESGTYFVRVMPVSNRATRYRLVWSARSTVQTSFAYEVVKRTNQIRRDRGLHSLALNTQLSRAAQAYAKNMATQDFFSHTGADGSTWQQRIRTSGYDFSDAAENLAIGHSTPASVVEGWMNSPGHQYNMLAQQIQEIGVGYFYLAQDEGKVNSNHYWAQSFGTPIATDFQFKNTQDIFNRDFPSRHRKEFFNNLDS